MPTAEDRTGDVQDPIACANAEKRSHFVELSRIVSGLAHEIKNPLSTINLNLKLLAEDLSRYDDEEHARINKRLRTVQGEADRVRLILDDFLKCAGTYEVHPEETDLGKAVEEMYDFFFPQAESNGVLLRIALPEEPVMCRIDGKLIKQAILNLMLNATQAMTGGGELLLKLAPGEREAVLEVIDTGPGIAPDQLDTIFQPYVSTKTGGTGLGLPIARRIVRDHGGTIDVESEDGKGTRFTIRLPVA